MIYLSYVISFIQESIFNHIDVQPYYEYNYRIRQCYCWCSPCCDRWKINNSQQGTVLLHPLSINSSSTYVFIHPSNIQLSIYSYSNLTCPTVGPQASDIPTFPSISTSCLLLGKFPFSCCHGNGMRLQTVPMKGYSPISHRHTHTHKQLYFHQNVIWFNQSAHQAATLIWHVILSVNSPQSESQYSV